MALDLDAFVVICFQFSIFELPGTTSMEATINGAPL